MATFSVREIQAATIINRVRNMPFQWSINPYRGCRHACVYCYARPTHEYLGLGSGSEFQEVILAKMNAPDLARRRLKSPSWRGDVVAIGTATDPYQQAESRYRLTRGILEAFAERHNGLTITTKSPMVLRDLDLLQEVARHASVTVHFTVTTMDSVLWRQIEPTTAKPIRRLEAMRILRQHGIRAGVFLSPILPGLTDDMAHLEAVVAAAADYGADFLWPSVLRLGPGITDYYLPFLENAYPALQAHYARLYRQNSASRAYTESVLGRVRMLKSRFGLQEERGRSLPHAVTPAVPVQPSLF